MAIPATTPQRQNYTIQDVAGVLQEVEADADTAGFVGWHPGAVEVLPTDSVTPCPQFVRS